MREKQFSVTWKEIVHRKMTVSLMAKSEQEAIEKVRSGDGYVSEDEKELDEDIIDYHTWRATEC